MSDNTQIVLDFIGAWNARDFDQIMSHFAPDCVYHNIPMEVLQGTEAIEGFIKPFIGMASEVDWQVHHIGESSEGVVMTERTDRFHIGENWLEIRVMGVFELEEGKLIAWRDYFDLAEFQQQMAGG